ncbi:hypothetical protein D9M71_688610 [compost metagenome]
MQGAGGGATVVIADDLGELVRQFAGESDFVRLPGAGRTGLFQAQHANHLAVDADAGIEHRVDIPRTQAFGHIPGTRVAHGIVGVDGAAGMQSVEVVGKNADVDWRRQQVFLGRAMVGRDGRQHRAFQMP